MERVRCRKRERATILSGMTEDGSMSREKKGSRERIRAIDFESARTKGKRLGRERNRKGGEKDPRFDSSASRVLCANVSEIAPLSPLKYRHRDGRCACLLRHAI